MAIRPFSRPVSRVPVRIVALACLLAARSDEPIVLSVKRINSPDGRTSAVIEELDNGLGFGLGALYQELHVVGATEVPRSHGERSRTVVFYVNTSEYRGSPIEAIWLSAKQLQVKYGKSLKPGRQDRRLGGVTIEYVAQ